MTLSDLEGHFGGKYSTINYDIFTPESESTRLVILTAISKLKDF